MFTTSVNKTTDKNEKKITSGSNIYIVFQRD